MRWLELADFWEAMALTLPLECRKAAQETAAALRLAYRLTLERQRVH